MNGIEFPQNSGDTSKDEEILREMRNKILRNARERFDEALGKELVDEKVYSQFAPFDVPSDDILAVLLTRDGERPFRTEEDEKEQLYLYFPSDPVDIVWVEHIKDGMHEKFTLTPEGLDTMQDADSFFMTEKAHEPTAEELAGLILPEDLQSDIARLGTLLELVERFELTPFS